MKNIPEDHLSHEQISQALVDESDLTEGLRKHLANCDSCLAEKEVFEGQLKRMGEMAREFAPSFSKKVSLPVKEKNHAHLFWKWNWGGLLATGLTAAMILAVFLWWATPYKKFHDDIEVPLTPYFLINEQLVVEIECSEEDPLSIVYFDISGETMTTVTDEFLDFVIPVFQNETQNHDIKKEDYHVVQV
jgi:hypothetical protein